MTDITPYDRAWKNPEINKRAVELSRAGNQWLTMGDLIAAATMIVLERDGHILSTTVVLKDHVFHFDPTDSQSLLTALLDALEAKDE